MIVSSLAVPSAYQLPSITQETGSQVVIINDTNIQLDGDLNIMEHKAGDVLEVLCSALKN